ARAYLNGPFIGSSLGSILTSLFSLSSADLAMLLAASGPLVSAQTSLGLTSNDNGFQVRVAQLPAPFIGPELPPDGASADLAEHISADAMFFASGKDLGSNPIMMMLVTVLSQVVVGRNVSSPGAGEPPDGIDQIEELTGIDLQAQLLDQLRGD